MEINMNNDIIEPSAVQTVSKENAKQYFLRIGFAITAMCISTTVLQMLVANLVADNLPEVYASGWFLWVASLAPLYLVGIPLFWYVLPKPAAAVPTQKRYGVGRLVVTCIIAGAAIMIFNYVGFYFVEIIRAVSGGKLGGSDALTSAVTNSPVWLTALCAGVLAPIMEELAFRKLLCDRVRPFGELQTCLFSGLMFGLFHGNFRQFFYAAALGVIFAYVYIKTNNIIYPIVMHAGINLFGSVIIPSLLSNENLNKIVEASENIELMTPEVIALSLTLVAVLFLGFAMAIAGIVLFIVFVRKIRFEQPELTVEGKVGRALYGNLGTIAAIIVMAASFVLSLL